MLRLQQFRFFLKKNPLSKSAVEEVWTLNLLLMRSTGQFASRGEPRERPFITFIHRHRSHSHATQTNISHPRKGQTRPTSMAAHGKPKPPGPPPPPPPPAEAKKGFMRRIFPFLLAANLFVGGQAASTSRPPLLSLPLSFRFGFGVSRLVQELELASCDFAD
jgi:hypothetical protein